LTKTDTQSTSTATTTARKVILLSYFSSEQSATLQKRNTVVRIFGRPIIWILLTGCSIILIINFDTHILTGL
jgi:hypothetical protein